MVNTKKASKPAIPQPQRIKHALDDLENAFIALSRTDTEEVLEKHEAMTGDKLLRCQCNLCGYYDAAKKLVRLDNFQLYHPLVEAIYSFPRQWDFLRSFHRKLATGVKLPLKNVAWITGKGDTRIENTLTVLNELTAGRIFYKEQKRLKRPQSFEQIQKSLEARGLIVHMCRTAFIEAAKRFMEFAKGGIGPFFNVSARPRLPRNLPESVKEAWNRARQILYDLRWTREAKQETLLLYKQENSPLNLISRFLKRTTQGKASLIMETFSRSEKHCLIT